MWFQMLQLKNWKNKYILFFSFSELFYVKVIKITEEKIGLRSLLITFSFLGTFSFFQGN